MKSYLSTTGAGTAPCPSLRPLCEADARLKLVNFSRNFGHQIAITAGMDMTRGDAVVVIDADLQDPPEVIPGMFERWKQGYEVVYGKRLSREGETFFKKFTAKVFYRFMARMTEVDMPVDTATSACSTARLSTRSGAPRNATAMCAGS